MLYDTHLIIYFCKLPTQSFQLGIDPLHFWELNITRFSTLRIVAMDMLSIPATSAPVERSFSPCGLSSNLNASITDEHFEK